MRRSLASFLVFVTAYPVFGQEQAAGNIRINDHPFQCGAMFAIASRFYEESGEESQFRLYKAKFEKLALKAEAEFKKRNRTKADAEAYMQEHIDLSLSLMERNIELVARFTHHCNRLFPD
ncbi:hypothetical protein LP421_10130 [Rhizobium sp. RCAM05350]|nr:hypothetical protein LP421_10130 [Rhizobium sp. RCAM05350]